jgi:chemotaxis signal transduction protein
MSTLQSPRGGFNTPLQQLFLLEERVRQAGVRMPDDMDTQQAFHGIKCVINGRDCVINLREVAEVIDKRAVTPIPGTAAWIEGVINYRGALVPVYRPHDFLLRDTNVDPVLASGNGHIVVLRQDRRGNEFTAIRVNRMYGMQKFNSAELRAPDCVESLAQKLDRTLDNYVDNLVNSDGKLWHRLNIGRLMKTMCGTSPRQTVNPVGDLP